MLVLMMVYNAIAVIVKPIPIRKNTEQPAPLVSGNGFFVFNDGIGGIGGILCFAIMVSILFLASTKLQL